MCTDVVSEPQNTTTQDFVNAVGFVQSRDCTLVFWWVHMSDCSAGAAHAGGHSNKLSPLVLSYKQTN